MNQGDSMDTKVRRRDFLKTAQVAGMLGYASREAVAAAAKTKAVASDIALSGKYTPVQDYPIQPKRYSEVTMKDSFWKPKITTNADVTIPFEVQKLTEPGSRKHLNGGVLEAAILSLRTHPDARLQAQVDAAIQTMKQATGSGNRDFEIAAAYYNATGNRELIDKAIESADKLYEDFRVRNPPFSGGE